MTGTPQQSLGEWIVERCRTLGFMNAGIAPVETTSHPEELRRWIDEGRHGSMAYLERNLQVRADPGALLPGARTLIMVADQYASRIEPEADAPVGHGRIARYARGRDYHTHMKRRLHTLCDELRAEHPDAMTRAFADTAPILEREHAARAGLGWVGKHTLLIDPRRGSYFFLGGVLTTLQIAPPASQRSVPDHCGTCTRCIDACPTEAIKPWSVDASQCIAYLTIERRLPIDREFHEAIGDWLFGCDVCQEVCPHNSRRDGDVQVGAPNDAYRARAGSFDLLEVLGWSEDDRRRACESSALKRATLDMFRRNALICAGNVIAREDAPDMRDQIESIAESDHEPSLVRDTARAILARLGL